MEPLVHRDPSSCLCIVVLVLSLFPVAAAVGAQGPTSDAALNPDVAFLIHAANSYGIVERRNMEPNTTPWHLKVSFQRLGQEGSQPDSGTYEEIFENLFVYKRIYHSNSFEQVQYGNAGGAIATGDPHFPPIFFELLRTAIEHPVMDASQIRRVAASPGSIASDYRSVAGESLHCYDIATERQPAAPDPITYCFDDQDKLVRYSIGEPPMGQATFMNPVQFEGRLLPSDVVLERSGVRFLVAHLETIESLSDASDALFQPPPNAKPLQPTNPAGGMISPTGPSSIPPLKAQSINISAGVAAGMLMQKTNPIYPSDALTAHVSGTVVLLVTIDTSGNVETLRVISGPPMLHHAALDAVKSWHYRPYILNGWPTPVETTVNVIFVAPQ
jgi:TonB family protein